MVKNRAKLRFKIANEYNFKLLEAHKLIQDYQFDQNNWGILKNYHLRAITLICDHFEAS